MAKISAATGDGVTTLFEDEPIARTSLRGRRGAPPTAILGPTNTGKTHYAIERLLAYPSGMIGLPLRLLAREIFDRIVAAKSAKDVALVTGEEKIIPPSPRYWVCTVEAMPLEREVDCLAIDEIQLAADPERGRVFTQRLLAARGLHETMFLGAETMRPILRRLFPDLRVIARERFSTLSHSGSRKVSRLPRRAAAVGFSAETIYSVAELIRRQRGGAAVIMGALSPRTRNAQAALYQSGEVDYLVATDAIGMGLNMDIDHVAFAGRRKFDGRRWRDLRSDELAQIAGRAGRHIRDGSFGTTGDCPDFDEETVAAIEGHEFAPVTALHWRSDQLDFSSIEALTAALAVPPPRLELQRARLGDDEDALARLTAEDDIKARLRAGPEVELLWRVCEIPDFRKLAPDQHARLIGEIFTQIVDHGRVSSAWLQPRVERLNRIDGDIDAISTRLAHIRTWTYLSHRSSWLEDAAYWQERARTIEDALSDELHQKLTQRFVDRRTSLLLRKLKDDETLLAGVSEDGEVVVEGQFVGRLLGFEFIVDPRVTGADAKRLRSAGERALAPVLAARAAALANAAPEDLSLRDDASIWWRSGPVASLKKGPSLLRPTVIVRGLDALSPHLRGRVQDRIQAFFSARIETLLSELIGLQTASASTEEGGLAPLARGVAFRLVEHLGAMSRSEFGDELKQLDQQERAKLRTLGVRFGEYTLFMPSLLKYAPARLLTMLWALWEDRPPAAYAPPKAGLVSLVAADHPPAYYYASGYRPSGARAVRVDMLERLAGLVRAARRDEYRGGFEATPQMMSVVGCSGEEFETILTSLGYKKQTMTVRRPAPVARPTTAPAAVVESAPTEHAPAESAAAPTVDADAAAEISPADAPAPDDAPRADALATPEAASAMPEAAPENAAPATEAVAETADDATPPAAESDAAAGPAAEAAAPAAASAPPAEQPLIDVEVTVWRHQPRRPPQERPQRHHARPQSDERRGERREGHRGPQQGGDGGPARDENRRGGPEHRRPPQGHAGPRPANAGGGANRPPRGDQRRPGPKGPPHRTTQHTPRPAPNPIEPRFLKSADPNSPFAVLAGLKEDLIRKKGGEGDAPSADQPKS